MNSALHIERILPLEQLEGLVSAHDWLTASGFRTPGRTAEYLMWHAVVYRELPGADIRYNAVGAPFVHNYPVQIGVAHCDGYVAVAFSSRPCAVDIELLSRDFSTAAGRFATERELALSDDPRLLAVLWCSKETLYKYAGRRELDFRRDLCIESVEFGDAAGRLTGRVMDCPAIEITLRFGPDYLAAYIL